MTGSLAGDIITVIAAIIILVTLVQFWREGYDDGGFVPNWPPPPEHPNCRCVITFPKRESVMAPTHDPDPRIWNPNASAWMHSEPGGTIDLDAMPVKK